MFGFWKRQKADVLEHWIAFVEGFQMAPSNFYESVEREIKNRTVPGLDMSRVDFAEGGLLSEKRVYLRMIRERLVFDVCAAPFGSSFFFSCRFAEIPAAIQFWQLIIIAGVLGFCGLFSLFIFVRSFSIFGFFLWPLAWVAFFVIAIYVMRNAVAMGLKDLDAALVKSSILGPLYERIRKDTYYRQDTRLMYLEIVSGVVKKLAEEATSAKGVKLIRQYEQAPILGELYKRVPAVTSKSPTSLPTPPSLPEAPPLPA